MIKKKRTYISEDCTVCLWHIKIFCQFFWYLLLRTALSVSGMSLSSWSYEDLTIKKVSIALVVFSNSITHCPFCYCPVLLPIQGGSKKNEKLFILHGFLIKWFGLEASVFFLTFDCKVFFFPFCLAVTWTGITESVAILKFCDPVLSHMNRFNL